jgi:hypothetical protein
VNFIRFGQRVINLDHINGVELLEDTVVLGYLYGDKPHTRVFEGEEAEILRKFFMEHSQDITSTSGGGIVSNLQDTASKGVQAVLGKLKKEQSDEAAS